MAFSFPRVLSSNCQMSKTGSSYASVDSRDDTARVDRERWYSTSAWPRAVTSVRSGASKPTLAFVEALALA